LSSDTVQREVTAQPPGPRNHLLDNVEAENDQDHMLMDGPDEEGAQIEGFARTSTTTTRGYSAGRNTPTSKFRDMPETPAHLISH